MKAAALPVLTSVIVVALTDEAYSQACSDSSLLVDAFFAEGTVLRQGDVLNISSPTNSMVPLQYRLQMIEPAIQGYAKEGETELLVLSSLHTDQPTEDTVDEDEDAIEISEDFLGSSILTTSANQQAINGHENSQKYSDTRPADHSPTRYALKSLTTPCNLIDDNCTLYLRTSDLGKVGILSGDWVCVVCMQSPSKSY